MSFTHPRWVSLGAYFLVCVCVFVCVSNLSCPTLCYPMDCSPPGSVHGILQARLLEWMAIPFFRGSSWPRDQTMPILHCGQTPYCLRHPGSPICSLGHGCSSDVFSSIYSLHPSPLSEILLYLPGSGAREESVLDQKHGDKKKLFHL